MNRIFYILVICCQAFGVSAQSVADAGLFTYSAAGTVTASLGGNGVAWGPDAFAVFRNSAQGALADAKVIAGYAVSSWMPGWDLADRHWIHDAGGLFTFGGRQAVLTGVRYLNLPIVELTDEEGNQVILKQIKQLKETLSLTPADRQDIIDECNFSISVLEEYAPKMMDESEIKAVIEETLKELSIETPTAQDKGKIMKVLMPKVKGKADGKLVNQVLGSMMA